MIFAAPMTPALASALPQRPEPDRVVKFVVKSSTNPDFEARSYEFPVSLIPEDSLLDELIHFYDNDTTNDQGGNSYEIEIKYPAQFPAVIDYLQNGRKLPRDICRTCQDPLALQYTLSHLRVESSDDIGY